jgi:hypothetical protein
MKTVFNCAPLFSALLALAGCSPALPGAPAAPAHASLAGLDPYDTGCAADASTTATALSLNPSGTVVARVELRRSERCQTAWARAVRISGARGALVASVHAGGLSSSFEHATDGEVWTDMVPAQRGCATAAGGVRGEDGPGREARATSCNDTTAGRASE